LGFLEALCCFKVLPLITLWIAHPRRDTTRGQLLGRGVDVAGLVIKEKIRPKLAQPPSRVRGIRHSAEAVGLQAVRWRPNSGR
jgi:hypothetical protein